MYTKKILSVSAAVAIMSSVAISFDMVPKKYQDYNNNTAVLGFSTIVIDRIDAPDENATYVFDSKINITAVRAMKMSSDYKGDTLIYPAFRVGEDNGTSGKWETEISVRNVKDVSVVAKAVLYNARDSKELKDFNVYLSSNDVARFKIKSVKVDDKDVIRITTRDGSIMAGLDQTLSTPAHVFVKHEDPENTALANIENRIDEDGDFVIADIPAKDNKDNKIDSGYVVIYVMAQTEETTTGRDFYHGNHSALYESYYYALKACRGDITIFANIGGSVKNGTAISEIKAPNVRDTCDNNYTYDPRYPFDMDGNGVIDAHEKTATDAHLHFRNPEDDILFGEVTISKVGSNDPRSLLLRATAIDNYTDDNITQDINGNDIGQMMLWAPGEYAAIQDRRIVENIPEETKPSNKYADYDNSGIAEDAKDMVKHIAYFTFDKMDDNLDNSVLIVTQPMKRALAMANHGEDYWKKVDVDNDIWGQFILRMTFYNENENMDMGEIQLVTITSPANSQDEVMYRPEMAPLKYDVLARGANGEDFITGQTNGYAKIDINPDAGLPCIVTEMTSKNVDNEAQINWIYSATE